MEVDVEQIMQEIRSKLMKEENWEDIPSFDSVPIRDQTAAVPADPASGEYAREVEAMNRTWELHYFWPLSENPVKRLTQRVIKRSLKFLFAGLIGQQNEFNMHAVRAMNETKKRVDALTDQITALTLVTEAQEGRIIELEQAASLVAELRNRAVVLGSRVDNFEIRIDDLLASLAETITAQKASQNVQKVGDSQPVNRIENDDRKVKEEENVYTALDYFKFENHFRGSRSEILKRQAIYLPYFKDQKGPILDFGCGRGEFLQLMKQNNIPAYGVDLYPEYAAEGELLEVDIRQEDGFAFLRDTEERFGGIYVGQVIEHISFQQLQELCVLAYEKLLPGAWLILETQNPMCLSIFSNAFYIDPTHNKPVHPLMVKYLLEELQFKDVDLLFTECSRLEPLPLIQSSEIANLEEVNAGISRVSELLFGSRDYAAVGRK